jgi:lysozyme
MAYLTLPQVQDMMLRKRRRDKGNPYLEERFALSDADRAGIYGLLDGQALSGVNIVDEYEDPDRIGEYTRWYGNPNTGTLGRDEMSIRSDVAGTDFQDVLAHEVGHRGHYLSGLLGTQAGPPRAPVRPFVEGVPQLGIENRTAWVSQVDPYVEQERMYTPDKSDRWHHVLYGMEGDRPVLSGGGRGEINQGILASDIEVANQLARNVPKRDVITYPKGEPTSLLSTDAPAPQTALSAQEGVSEGITMDELRHHGSNIKSKAGNLVSTVKEMFKGEPTSIKEAQAQGKSYFMKDGKKQLAVTGEQLAKFKKSDLYDSGSKKSALSQWANIANKKGGMKKLFPEEKKELKPATPKADQKAASDTAFNKIAEWEGGYQSSTFDDPGDKSNRIGYGRIAKKGEVTTKAKEDKWLKGEIDSIGKYLDEVVTADLTPNQRAALTSLIFNVGRTSFKGSKALAALNAGDMDEFRKQAFSKEKGWVKSGGKRMEGLVNRRKKEEDLFFG